MNGGPGDKQQLGKIALKQVAVAPSAMEDLLAHPTSGRGAPAPADRLKTLAEQFGVPGLDLNQVVIPLENLKLIPHEVGRQYGILPIVVKDDRILLAMSNPADRRPIDEIEFVTGRRVHPYVALPDELRKAVDDAYRRHAAGDDYYIGAGCTAEYLTSIGLGHLAAQRPPAPPSMTTTNPAIAASTPGMPRPPAGAKAKETDDLGIEELSNRKAAPSTALDDAFGSRVGPLPGAPPKARAEQPKVLVVDDEDDIRKMLVRVLVQKGYQVIEAAKGLEALQLVRDQMPDLILLDAMLPEVHGFDIARRIKGSARYGHIPIIMVSAIYRGWRVAEDLKSSYGVEAFLEKPFKIGDVIMHVENALAGRSHQPREDDILGREAQAFLDQAMQSYRAGDLDAAIDKLREGLGIDPLAFQLHYHLGLLYGRRDNVFDAIHELERAVDLQPRNFSALKNLAVLYQKVGFKHKATEIWERALATAPDDETRLGIKEHLMSLL